MCQPRGARPQRAGDGARLRCRVLLRTINPSRGATRTADAPARCRNISCSAPRLRARSSPNRASAIRRSCEWRGRDRSPRRKARPGGAIRPFCEPDMATSMPQASHLERHAAERGDGIDHEQSVVFRRLDGAADGFDVVECAGGRIDLHDEDRLDLAIDIGAQSRFDLGRSHRAAPTAFQHLDLDAHRGRGRTPADREASAFQHEHLVAARQHVGEGGFPTRHGRWRYRCSCGPWWRTTSRDRAECSRSSPPSQANRCRVPGDASRAALRPAWWWGREWRGIHGLRERPSMLVLMIVESVEATCCHAASAMETRVILALRLAAAGGDGVVDRAEPARTLWKRAS